LEGGHKDGAYAAILTLLPAGLKGLAIAALTAAIVASLAGKSNSISTIFTLDIYKKYLHTKADEKQLVWVGRLTIVAAIVIGVLFTWNDLLDIGGAGGYTFVQKYSSFISPGVFATFILGMFWKRTSGAAAVAGIIVGFAASVFFNQAAVKLMGPETILYSAFPNAHGEYEIPFFISLGWSFLTTIIVMVAISLAGPRVSPKAFVLDRSMFRLSPSSVILIAAIVLLLSALYVKFW
jgi:SSS family solute:Na+ symporter